jgi:CTP:molybdopterin cytidylyltransferase MocA
MKIRKAVFPVAGLGTRFLPATKAMPKEMLPVVDKPLIQYAVEEALASGIEQIVFVTGSGKTSWKTISTGSTSWRILFAERVRMTCCSGSKVLSRNPERSFTPGRVSRLALVMPSGAPGILSAMSLLRYCWPMI